MKSVILKNREIACISKTSNCTDLGLCLNDSEGPILEGSSERCFSPTSTVFSVTPPMIVLFRLPHSKTVRELSQQYMMDLENTQMSAVVYFLWVFDLNMRTKLQFRFQL